MVGETKRPGDETRGGRAETKLLPSETQESIALANWLRRNGVVFLHIPNEGKRSKRTGALLKAMGMMPGFPDYLILTEPRCWVELKTRDGGSVRASHKQKQEKWHMVLRAVGLPGVVANGAQEAVEWLKTKGFGA